MKLRNKLILSCAALAAVATTAVSTTYAWYTSNTEVTATDITATTKNAGADLLLISKDKTNWGTTVSFSTESAGFDELTPLAYVASSNTSAEGEAAKVLGALGTTTVSTATDGTGYASFTLYLKNGANTSKTVNMKFTGMTNTTAATALPAKSIIDSANNSKFLGEATTSSTYTVNALRVLCADIEVFNYTTAAPTAPTFTSENCYSLAKTALATSGGTYAYGDTLQGKTAASAAITTVGSTYSATQYYNAIMENDLGASNSETITDLAYKDSTVSFTVPAAGDATTKDDFIQITFKLFINGWDEACFDACQGQSFSFGLHFEIPQA